jgi:hypothetical protein
MQRKRHLDGMSQQSSSTPTPRYEKNHHIRTIMKSLYKNSKESYRYLGRVLKQNRYGHEYELLFEGVDDTCTPVTLSRPKIRSALVDR